MGTLEYPRTAVVDEDRRAGFGFTRRGKDAGHVAAHGAMLCCALDGKWKACMKRHKQEQKM